MVDASTTAMQCRFAAFSMPPSAQQKISDTGRIRYFRTFPSPLAKAIAPLRQLTHRAQSPEACVPAAASKGKEAAKRACRAPQQKLPSATWKTPDSAIAHTQYDSRLRAETPNMRSTRRHGDRTDIGRSLVRRSESTDIRHYEAADMALNVDRHDLMGADNFIGGRWRHRSEAALRHRLHCSLHSRKTIDFSPGE